MGLFARLKQGLSRTRGGIAALFGGSSLDADFLEELEATLIAADVGWEPTSAILQRLRDSVAGQGALDPARARLILRDQIEAQLRPAQRPLVIGPERPTVIMLVGVNGGGKTTTIGKIVHWLAGQGRTALLAAGDTFRAAAREQLTAWGRRNGVDIIGQDGGDPAAVAFDAIRAGQARGVDVVLVDTAGRLPSQTHLLQELARVRRAQAKALPGAPREVILVLDGTTGQNAISQVRAFDEHAGLTGLIVTKLDGTARGGILLALTASRGERPLPIYFVGVGEGLDDLQPFDARAFASALVGVDEDGPDGERA